MGTMTTLKALSLALAMAATACVSGDGTYGQNTTPQPVQVSGPPGASADPNAPPPGWGPPPGYGPSINYGNYGNYGPQQPPQPGVPPQGYPGAYPGAPGPGMDPNQQYAGMDPNAPNGMDPSMDPNAGMDPNADPNEPPPGDFDMNAVTDQQIDQTLDNYGTWEDDPDYGRVWRPDVTQVGVDFTPYVSCGSWVNSDAGWAFDCPMYSWGWLPFHYGRWGWFGAHWGWVPGHQWGAAWVDWRHGGGYVGWRPMAPAPGAGRAWGGPSRVGIYDSQWRFTGEADFAKPNIGAHLFNNPAEGLRVTTRVARPAVAATTRPIQAASLMRARYNTSVRANTAMQARIQAARTTPAASAPTYHGSSNAYRAPSTAYRAPSSAYRAPAYHSAPVRQMPDRESPSPHYSSGSYSSPHASGGSSESYSHSSSSSSSHSSSGGGGHSSGGGGHRR